jgi:hypothetical protein
MKTVLEDITIINMLDVFINGITVYGFPLKVLGDSSPRPAFGCPSKDYEVMQH